MIAALRRRAMRFRQMPAENRISAGCERQKRFRMTCARSVDTKKGRSGPIRNLPKLNSLPLSGGAQSLGLTPSATDWSLSPGPEPQSPQPAKWGCARGSDSRRLPVTQSHQGAFYGRGLQPKLLESTAAYVTWMWPRNFAE